MTSNQLTPAVGCFVSHKERERNVLGVVIGHCEKDSIMYVQVQWGSSGVIQWHTTNELSSGFRNGHIVQDKPISNIRRTLGAGVVRGTRQIANRDLVLVQFHNTGESRWIPYENLIRIKDAEQQYLRSENSPMERFQLKALAYALDSWNQVTGALDRFDVDPLPHQIDLVHRIMTSDHSNWLIADDVGLGKTIEVGLLLAAMKRRRQARRVLVVCPASVVRQWQDEMRYKFNEDFRIYGLDFNINQPSHWSSFDKVIVSIDRAKSDLHLSVFKDSGEWDVIVFDEAHHLSKIESQATTLRYHLAESLQGMTDSLIFLTGTPHQGRTDQFANLLLLLRPDLSRRIRTMFSDSSVVAEIVLRNRKSLVTDASGNFIFKGQSTTLIEVPLSSAAASFNVELQRYLQEGYAASEAGGNTGRAIGFVMTTYRKLASSSVAAIERALLRRQDRLQGMSIASTGRINGIALDELEDSFEEGSDGIDDLHDVAEALTDSYAGGSPFFDDELRQITSLCTAARELRADDYKLQHFLTDIIDPLYREGQPVLVFTEYRATQEYLVAALQQRYADIDIAQINGSMSLNEKRSNIDKFNTDTQFLVSTEAGGEGINLHERCHILVNYDLPWNPRRLVQRAGRLYRYGQKERVMVFNLMAEDSFDNQALALMMRRVLNIAQDLSQVGSEFREGITAEIIGEIMDRLDIASLLAQSREMEITRTATEIEAALTRAQQSRSQQERLFSNIESYDPSSAGILHTFGPGELLSFLERILPYLGVTIRERLYNGRVLELELPEELRGQFSEFPQRASVVRVTVDRQLAMRDSRLVPMDFSSPFFRMLIEYTKSPGFGGEYASFSAPFSGTLGIYKLRWQNDQGVPRWEALMPVFLPQSSPEALSQPGFFASLLLERNETSHPAIQSDRIGVLARMRDCASTELAAACTTLRHPNDLVLVAAADLTSP